MPLTTSKMGLRAWNLGTDPYDHTQFTNNLSKVDYHDHTAGRGVQVPTAGVEDGAITTSKLAGGIAIPPGIISMFGGGSAPTGYLLCDGSSYSRAAYASLFAAIGTANGSVDGASFNVPDMRQRFPLGKAAAGTGSTVGATGGAIDYAHTHTAAHSHALSTAGGAKIGVGLVGTNPNGQVAVTGPTPFVTGPTYAYGATALNFAATSTGLATSTGASVGSAPLVGATDTNALVTDASTPYNPPFSAVNFVIKT